MGIEGHKRRKGTKVHVVVNRRGLPLCVEWGPGNEHDSQKLKALLEGVRLRKRGRTRPRVVYGDGAYDSEAIRAALRRRGIRAGIRENPRGRKKARNASMKKRITRSGVAWSSSLRGGREGFGGFP